MGNSEEHEPEDVKAALFIRLRHGKNQWHAIIPVAVHLNDNYMYLRPQTLCGWQLTSIQYEQADERSPTRPERDLCRHCAKRYNALT